MSYTNVVFVRHEGGNKPFLFECLNAWDLKDGDTVICDTQNGEQPGKVVGTPLYLGKPELDTIAKAVRAVLPLRRVSGVVTVQRFDYPEEGEEGLSDEPKTSA